MGLCGQVKSFPCHCHVAVDTRHSNRCDEHQWTGATNQSTVIINQLVEAYSHTPLPGEIKNTRNNLPQKRYESIQQGNSNLQKSLRDQNLYEKFRSPSGTIGSVVMGFKASVTARANSLRSTLGSPIWQSNYFETIIRTENTCI